MLSKLIAFYLAQVENFVTRAAAPFMRSSNEIIVIHIYVFSNTFNVLRMQEVGCYIALNIVLLIRYINSIAVIVDNIAVALRFARNPFTVSSRVWILAKQVFVVYIYFVQRKWVMTWWEWEIIREEQNVIKENFIKVTAYLILIIFTGLSR